jgi:hypothetical protein
MVFPEYGSDRDFVWAEQTCSWCDEQSDDDRPCSPDCERLAVRAARTKRIVGLVDAIQRATRLRAQYRDEGVPGDRRIADVDAVIADYDRQIGETVAAQVKDDGEERDAVADTMPAPREVA